MVITMAMVEKIFVSIWIKRKDGSEYRKYLTKSDWWTYSVLKEDGVLHREGLPAAEYANGIKAWYVDGILHRIDGPAITYDYDGIDEWWVNGKKLITEEVENWIVDNNIDLTTEEGQLAVKLKWM